MEISKRFFQFLSEQPGLLTQADKAGFGISKTRRTIEIVDREENERLSEIKERLREADYRARNAPLVV